MAFTRLILATLVAVFALQSSATPLSRSKRQTVECRKEGLMVGGTVINSEYIFDVATEADCVAKCHELEKCTAVNYFPDYQACLPQEESLATHKESLNTADNPTTTYIIVKGCESAQRRKRDIEGCRKEGLIVGATFIGEDYLWEVKSEQDCIEKCNAEQECNAINYFPLHEACLLQRETLITDVESLSTAQDSSAVYVIVKGCQGSMPEPRPQPEGPMLELVTDEPEAELVPQRRKRNAECRKENLFVGGSVVGGAYIENIKSEADCIAECQKLEQCTAVNYFPFHEACLPQEENLITTPDLQTREEDITNYIIVKGCTGPIPDPKPQPDGPILELVPDQATTEAPILELVTDEPEGPLLDLVTDEPATEPEAPKAELVSERRKRNADCRRNNLLVGGTPVTGGYIMNIKSEEECIMECNKLEQCTAINYFPLYDSCLLQEENLNNTPDLQTREEDITNYIIVKGCGGSQPENPEFPPLPRPE